MIQPALTGPAVRRFLSRLGEAYCPAIRDCVHIFIFAALASAFVGCDSETTSPSLSAPELVGPIDGASFATRSLVEFSWAPVEAADVYEISFEYEDYPEADSVYTTVVPLTVQELIDIGPISWTVRARSTEGNGPWSKSRTVVSLASEVLGEEQFAFRFSTTGIGVGEEIFVASGRAFATIVLGVVADRGGLQADIRDIRITSFDVAITDPPGTVLDQFTDWRVTAGPPQSEVAVLQLPDPAPPVDAVAGQAFLRPDGWLSLALDPGTVIGMKADTNPRSPKEAEVVWDLTLSFNVLINR